jgi:molecular chaperone DnaK
MFLGIDLGTSNSAVAGLVNHAPRVFKTAEGADVMPSVLYLDARGNLTVGVRARDRTLTAPENTYARFKRLMGTSTPHAFAAAKRAMTPEQASTELLRALVGQAEVESGGEAVEGAVVTIPAAFNQLQSEATLRAAEAAGLDRVALLQEPVAAAMAAMGGAPSASGQFLVYDIGGGTFDLALVQALRGDINIIAHEGINMLGGTDFDTRLVNALVRPWLAANFKLPPDAKDHRLERLWRQARHAAELAKIALSTTAETSISASEDDLRLEDLDGNPVYLDVPVTRSHLDDLVREKVEETITLTRKMLADNHLTHEDIDRIVLIGGPTKMPLIREYVPQALGIPCDATIDPMTAVAIGAAIFAGSRDWTTGGATTAARLRTASAGPVKVELEADAITGDDKARIRIRPLSGVAGHTVQLDSELGWTSGRLPIATEQIVTAPLPQPGPHAFRLTVFDANGRLVAESTQTITITRSYATASGIPMTHTLAVRVAVPGESERDTLEALVSKGTLLPAHGEKRFRAVRGLKASEPGWIALEVFQVDDMAIPEPDLHLYCGQFRIHGRDLTDGLSIRAGDEVVVGWTVTEGGVVEAEITLPSVGQSFATGKAFSTTVAEVMFGGTEGEALATAELALADEALAEAERTLPLAGRSRLAGVRARLDEQRAALAHESDADCHRNVTEVARKARQDIAKLLAEPSARGAVMLRQLADVVARYNEMVRAGADSADSERFDMLARNAQAEITAGRKESFDRAEQQIDLLSNLYWRNGLRQAAFLASLFRALRETRWRATDKAAFDRAVARGDRALAAGQLDELRRAIFAIWEAQPRNMAAVGSTAPASLMRA